MDQLRQAIQGVEESPSAWDESVIGTEVDTEVEGGAKVDPPPHESML